MCCDVLGELLHEQGLADHDLFDRFLEELGKPRHVNTLARRLEIDRAVDLGRDQFLVLSVADADGFLDPADAGPGQCERHLGRRGLQVVC